MAHRVIVLWHKNGEGIRKGLTLNPIVQKVMDEIFWEDDHYQSYQYKAVYHLESDADAAVWGGIIIPINARSIWWVAELKSRIIDNYHHVK